MWKSGFYLTAAIKIFPQGIVYNFLFIHKDKINVFSQRNKQENYPHSTVPVDKLQTRINICRNVPDVILQSGVSFLQGAFHFIDGVNDGGVIFIQLLTDFRCTQVGEFADQINSYLTGLHSTLVFQSTPQNIHT